MFGDTGVDLLVELLEGGGFAMSSGLLTRVTGDITEVAICPP
jgi:hypothetical protein